MTDTDLAYLAGLIDGEGSIFLANGIQPRVCIQMSTESPLDWVHETFGGRLRTSVNGWVWGLYSYEGVKMLLEEVLPYLKLKLRRAEEVIKYCEGK